MKGDAQDIIQKLQREIDVLKKAIAEAPKKPDLEVSFENLKSIFWSF